MKIQSILQGLDTEHSHTIGYQLKNAFESGQYDKFTAIIAFASKKGIEYIISWGEKSTIENDNITICLGVDLKGTSKEALEKIIERDFNGYIFHTTSTQIFHPKLYLFENCDKAFFINGSSNLTEYGLTENIELCTTIELDLNKEDDKRFLENIKKTIIQRIIDINDPNIQELNPATISELDSSGNLPTESEREGDKKTEKDNEDIKESFPPRESAPNEKLDRDYTEVKKFWYETGKMTGGAANQLDLSKTGGGEKRGGVTFFGIPPRKCDVRKMISIIYHGKEFKENIIKYTPDNENWRIQLGGEADNGDKLTDEVGTFKEKIIIFHKVSNNKYEIQLENENELENIIDDSLFHAKSNGIGRHFGILE